MRKKKWFAAVVLITVLALLLGSAATVSAAEGDTPPAGKHRRGVGGRVTGISGHALTVQTRSGEEVQVVTGEETIFRVPGVEAASIKDISVGDVVIAVGTWSGTTFHARLVGVPPNAAQRGKVGGQVSSVEGSSIVVNTLSGETATVHTDADTAFRIPGIEEPGLDDIQPGDLIGAAGAWNDDGSLQAAVVAVPREAERHRRQSGDVTAIEGTTLTVRTGRGMEVALATDGETAFHAPGVEDAALSDLEVGDRVTVEVWTREGSLYAKTVVVWPEQPARVIGRVTSIEGATLVLETRRGAVQVLTDGGTLFRIPGAEEATLADIEEGDAVACGGEWEGEDSFRALVVATKRGQGGMQGPQSPKGFQGPSHDRMAPMPQ